MKKTLALICTILLTAPAYAEFTINFGGGILYNENTSSPLADGSLVIAVTTTTGLFSGPVDQSFFSGDDVFLGSWSTNSSVGAEGAFSAALTGLTLDTDIVTGQKIAIYWFPTATSLSDLPSTGDHYGFYTDSSWLVPADGATVSLNLETVAIGGAVSDSATVATFTVAAVPEPATYAAMLGAAALGFCVWRKRRVA